MNKNSNKETGILLHISSLPSKYGIGTFGEEAFKFVDFLKACNMNIWQILPLNITSYGDSPYQSPSSKALNYYFIDFDILIQKGLLKKEEVVNEKWFIKPLKVDYGIMFSKKIPLLKKAFSRFDITNRQFIDFVKNNNDLFELAIFMSIKEFENYKPWNKWTEPLKNHDFEAIKEFAKKNMNLINFYLWTQFEAFNEYSELKKYANNKGIKIMGDIPIYVSYDSVEVWSHPELFELDEHKEMINMSGHPADFYSKEGQLWGNPLYKWDAHKKSNYEWWISRVDYALKLYDLLRIDHFRGFSAYFSIPYGDKNALRGKWIKGPGNDLFDKLKNYPIVAEDLGLLDNEFYEFFNKTGYPGMRLINQAFDYEGRDGYWRPSNYTNNYFAYTSTHDSSTLLGLIKNKKNHKKEFEMLKRILNDECHLLNVDNHFDSFNDIVYKCIELCLASKAKTTIIAMQDLLLLDDKSRMNQPSSIGDFNWSWRMTKRLFNKNKKEIQKFLLKSIKKYT